MRNESCIRKQRISTSTPLHAPCSAMRSTEDTRERCNQKPPATCRAFEIMRMMSCVGGQTSVSQMNFLLHDSIWLQSMDSNPSISCRTFDIMRINKWVVEQKTVQCISKFFYVMHVSFTSLAAFYCPLLDNPQIFLKSWIDIRRSTSCFVCH